MIYSISSDFLMYFHHYLFPSISTVSTVTWNNERDMAYGRTVQAENKELTDNHHIQSLDLDLGYIILSINDARFLHFICAEAMEISRAQTMT